MMCSEASWAHWGNVSISESLNCICDCGRKCPKIEHLWNSSRLSTTLFMCIVLSKLFRVWIFLFCILVCVCHDASQKVCVSVRSWHWQTVCKNFFIAHDMWVHRNSTVLQTFEKLFRKSHTIARQVKRQMGWFRNFRFYVQARQELSFLKTEPKFCESQPIKYSNFSIKSKRLPQWRQKSCHYMLEKIKPGLLPWNNGENHLIGDKRKISQLINFETAVDRDADWSAMPTATLSKGSHPHAL